MTGKILSFGLGLVLLASATVASAEDAVPVGNGPFGSIPAIADREIAQVAGQADLTQVAESTNVASVTNNRVIGNTATGTIAFDGQAFQNVNGLLVVNANTGLNAAMNASMQVNVAYAP